MNIEDKFEVEYLYREWLKKSRITQSLINEIGDGRLKSLFVCALAQIILLITSSEFMDLDDDKAGDLMERLVTQVNIYIRQYLKPYSN